MLAQARASSRATRTRYGFEIKWDGVRAVAHVDARPPDAHGPQRHRLHAALPGGARAGERAGLPAADPRRRGGGVRLGGPAELRAAPVAHAPGLRLGGAAAHEDVPWPTSIFDLLWLEGHSTLALPYADRRKLLAELELEGPSWRAPAHREGDGAALLEASRGAGPRGHRGQAPGLARTSRAGARRAGSRSRTSAARTS